MSWFRVCSVIFAAYAVVFVFFPRFSNEFGGIGYAGGGHAVDWTQIVGLFSLAFAVLLHEAHRSAEPALRRGVARGVLALTLPCALLMTYWQIIPDRRWIRLDMVNIALLYLMSVGMFLESEFRRPQQTPAEGAHP